MLLVHIKCSFSLWNSIISRNTVKKEDNNDDDVQLTDRVNMHFFFRSEIVDCLKESTIVLSSCHAKNLNSQIGYTTYILKEKKTFRRWMGEKYFMGAKHLIKSFSQSIQNDIVNKLKQIQQLNLLGIGCSLIRSRAHGNGVANSL